MLSEIAERETPNQEHRKGRHWHFLLPILVIYLALACYSLDYQSLWKDEILSVRDASSAAAIWRKGHGPFYFALLHVWKYVTQSDLGLRALSVLIGAVGVGSFYAAATTLFDRRTTLFGTLLFATSPFVIWYSQEVRYIILMLAMTSLAMYTFRRLADRTGPTPWLTYGGALILAISAFVANVFLPLAHGLYLLWSPSRRQQLKTWLVCMVFVSIPLGIWAGNKLSKTVEVTTTTADQQNVSINPKKLSRGSAKAFSPVVLPYTFFAFSAGFSQGPSVHDLHQSQSLATVMPYLPTLATLSVIFGVLFIAGFAAVWRQPDVGKFLSLWMFVPLCGVLGMAFITDLGFNVRYAAMALPAYLLILAAGITWFRQRLVQLLLLAAVLCSNGISLANYYANPYYARADARAGGQYLKAVNQAHDAILAVGSTRALTYYLKGDLPFSEINVRDAVDLDLTAVLQGVTQGHKRLWVIEIRPWERDPKGKIKAALDRMYDRIEQRDFPGVAIRAYHLAP